MFSKLIRTFSTKNKEVSLLGYPFAGGQPRAGVEHTPIWLFEQEFVASLCKSYPVTTQLIEVTYPGTNISQHPSVMNIPGANNHINTLVSSKRLE
jgi:hypothetical protein